MQNEVMISVIISVDNAEKDSRIKYFYKKNGGVCSVRHFGLKQAGERYIFFMDNNDEIDSRLFEDNIALLKNKGEKRSCEVLM